jgi:hypothetical protein
MNTPERPDVVLRAPDSPGDEHPLARRADEADSSKRATFIASCH